MELCTQCNQPESAHTRRIFGHAFQRPQSTEEPNPGYAADLVDALAIDTAVDIADSAAADTGCDSSGGDVGSGDCGADAGSD